MGRYMTVTKAREPSNASRDRLTKRETVALMHATVTGMQQQSKWWVIGAARTQSIAIDEIFGKSQGTMLSRQTVTLRKSGLRSTIAESAEDSDEENIVAPTKMMRGSGLCTGRNGLNLLFMIILWITSCFNYSVINFYMKYVPGTIYLNFSVAGLSEIAAHITVGALYVKLTPRWTFFIGYSIALAGSLCLIFQGRFGSNPAEVAGFVLLAKYGVSMAMCACYVSTPFVFPVMQSGTAFGICNSFGRFFAIVSPFAAELDIPLPMEIFSLLNIVGIVCCLFVTTKHDEHERSGQESAAANSE